MNGWTNGWRESLGRLLSGSVSEGEKGWIGMTWVTIGD